MNKTEQVNVRLSEEAVARLETLARPAGRTKQAVVEAALETLWALETHVATGPLNESELAAADLLAERYRGEPLPGLAVDFMRRYGQRLIDTIMASPYHN